MTDKAARLIFKTRIDEDGNRYSWSVHDDRGGIEAWVTENVEVRRLMFCTGGVETHYATRPKDFYRDDDGEPCHDRCPVLDGEPCWHDGSSILFNEMFEAAWVRCGRNPYDPEFLAEMRQKLTEFHDSTFGREVQP
jgi:hypothetical protein